MNQERGFAEHQVSKRYFDRTFESEAVEVLPGECFVTATSVLMVTVAKAPVGGEIELL
jgi:hypothetical protein